MLLEEYKTVLLESGANFTYVKKMQMQNNMADIKFKKQLMF
jgi:hypothetical protein